MKKQNSIALDIRVARNKAGLRQADCAHLLGVHKSRISRIEAGRTMPTVREIATLSIVLGQPMESLLSGVRGSMANNLIERLRTIPSAPRNLPEMFNRAHTLSQLAMRLEALTTATHEGA
ncbi:helix-turn-helix domain-containing protein [Rhizobium sp. LjRoot254]|uniref:helix-turn-helix domain-containing protein n=1 Tax=Rhizobium sp. LjRoot254 TaxID=3342297 RepID=UPI003ECF0465